jgi:hypothetical protein
MMSLDQINHRNREAAVYASADKLEPFIVTAGDIAEWQAGAGLPLPFPYIGDHDPAGYEPAGRALFVDTSGIGESNESALTLEQLLSTLEPDTGYAFTSLGEFQGHLQPYRVLKYRESAV